MDSPQIEDKNLEDKFNLNDSEYINKKSEHPTKHVSVMTSIPTQQEKRDKSFYISYIDVYQFYEMLDKFSVDHDVLNVKQSSDAVDIGRDYEYDNKQETPTYIYRTRYISYKSMISILDDMCTLAEKHANLKQLFNIQILLNYLQGIFPQIHTHLDYNNRKLNTMLLSN
jgi:hypothetical protein